MASRSDAQVVAAPLGGDGDAVPAKVARPWTVARRLLGRQVQVHAEWSRPKIPLAGQRRHGGWLYVGSSLCWKLARRPLANGAHESWHKRPGRIGCDRQGVARRDARTSTRSPSVAAAPLLHGAVHTSLGRRGCLQWSVTSRFFLESGGDIGNRIWLDPCSREPGRRGRRRKQAARTGRRSQVRRASKYPEHCIGPMFNQ